MSKRRRRGEYVCYFDTAGSQLDDGILVTVGVVASRKKWDRFDKRWLAILGEFNVQRFHMHDVAHWKGDLESWGHDESRRLDFLSALIAEINGTVNKVMIRGLVLSDYKAIDQKYELTEMVGGQYSLGQASCFIAVTDWMFERKHPASSVGFCIEEGDAGQPALKKFLRENLHIRGEITFAKKIDSKSGEDVTPFSAADLIAYEHRLLYNRAEKAQQMPPVEKWRGSIRAIRRRLPVSAGILESGFLERFCTGLAIPRRDGA